MFSLVIISNLEYQVSNHTIRKFAALLTCIPLLYLVCNEVVLPRNLPKIGNIADIRNNAAEKYRQWAQKYAAGNMDTSFWGSDAETFRPERWLKQPDTPGFTYGHGYRMCVGSLTANWELCLVFMRMLGCFEILGGSEVDTHPGRAAADPTSMVTFSGRYEVYSRSRNEKGLSEILEGKEMEGVFN